MTAKRNRADTAKAVDCYDIGDTSFTAARSERSEGTELESVGTSVADIGYCVSVFRTVTSKRHWWSW